MIECLIDTRKSEILFFTHPRPRVHGVLVRSITRDDLRVRLAPQLARTLPLTGHRVLRLEFHGTAEGELGRGRWRSIELGDPRGARLSDRIDQLDLSLLGNRVHGHAQRTALRAHTHGSSHPVERDTCFVGMARARAGLTSPRDAP